MEYFRVQLMVYLGFIAISLVFVSFEVDAKLNLRHKLLRQSPTKNESLVYQQETKNNVFKSMKILFYKNNTKTLESSASIDANIVANSGCSPSEKFAIVLHGWIQSCNDDWSLALIDRLSYYRGGCVICIDYSVIASSSYMRLYSNFERITTSIVSIILSLIKYGFDPGQAYMFGFSFGGQLASAVGRSLRPQYVLQNIDTCDMAGPGFDPITIDHSKAGKHVQCFHSSRDKGTFIHACHRNIMLGNCGLSQPSVASQLHLGSHGLCVDIYINSFDYPFYAVQPPAECTYFGTAAKIPSNYTVGYDENFNNQVLGKIFVPTSIHYPYNLSKKEVALMSRDKQ
ncbi:pancreatic lipase-related protein 2 [Drosophila willistoni]|nr:pancreatic lipase-related protein 2 [Drosophila willistoni]